MKVEVTVFEDAGGYWFVPGARYLRQSGRERPPANRIAGS